MDRTDRASPPGSRGCPPPGGAGGGLVAKTSGFMLPLLRGGGGSEVDGSPTPTCQGGGSEVDGSPTPTCQGGGSEVDGSPTPTCQGGGSEVDGSPTPTCQGAMSARGPLPQDDTQSLVRAVGWGIFRSDGRGCVRSPAPRIAAEWSDCWRGAILACWGLVDAVGGSVPERRWLLVHRSRGERMMGSRTTACAA